MVIPLPFSRAIFLYSDPIAVERDEETEHARVRVERAMNAVAERAEEEFETLWGEAR